ncbi:leucine-rich repeat and IQ domain-containing protein 3-like [Myxocyprinus asiaticus]|uniref:leucine-rich repeat and IQ domain-containing protein 3-like n=1 Tax=Myxocyprinus asiaticus TaxID=70543 RepID=UPI0022238356|nr:leucine-rich repeat and IQ domain-containing protein 3-like [Myxocyprinus asiaticus]
MDSLGAYWAYLVNCSQSLILDHGHWASESEKASDLQDIVMVTLSNLLLKNLDQIESCRTLRICLLADNFLTRIEALMECTRLVKLDLKGNQIVQIPDASCWSHLKELQLLYLHDNNMATWNHIRGLSGCLNLTALTLYDTPISLKNFRHCVVNNIWSLKALDNYVISDEEIIQNWYLPFKFKAMKQHFHVNLYPSSKSDSFETEMKAVYKIIAEINRIQAIYSPTLIIQRWIRGHLIRKSLGLCGTKKQTGPEKLLTPIPPEMAENEQVSSQSRETMEQDTDDYHVLTELWGERDVEIKRLHVNLNKLIQTGHPEVLQEVINAKSFDSQQELNPPYNTPQQSLSLCIVCLYDKATGDLCDEEVEEGTFRVLGLKVSFHQTEPLRDMLLSRKAGGQDIREAISHFHNQKPGPHPLSQPHSPAITSRKHMIGRCHDGFSLTPFKVIEKAHQAFKKAEMQRDLAEKVTERQIDREVAKGHRYDFMEAIRKEACLHQERERADMEKTLSLQRAKQDQDIQQARQKHAQFVEEKRQRIQEQEMVFNFTRQHNSLARAVLRYNTWKSGNQQ